MQITLIPGRELGRDLVDRWTELQRSNPLLISPFFAPEFTSVVAAARNDVEIALIQEGGEVVGFFPFQRESKTIGRAVGHPLSDYHGVVCASELVFDPLELLRACKLVAWDFDHLLVSQRSFQPFHQFREFSPIIDLSEGFDRYLEERKSSGSGLRRPLQFMRKLEREVGPLRFEKHVKDIAVLHWIMDKKSEQYNQSLSQADLFAQEWIRNTVETIFQIQTPEFGGMLSVLNAGSERIAALLNIRSSNVWHGWFLGFEDRFASYSPGFLLWLKMAECASRLGIGYLDFGKGDQLYKKRLMNASIPLACGSVELPSWVSFRRGAERKLRALVKSSPLGEPLRRVMHRSRRMG